MVEPGFFDSDELVIGALVLLHPKESCSKVKSGSYVSSQYEDDLNATGVESTYAESTMRAERIISTSGLDANATRKSYLPSEVVRKTGRSVKPLSRCPYLTLKPTPRSKLGAWLSNKYILGAGKQSHNSQLFPPERCQQLSPKLVRPGVQELERTRGTEAFRCRSSVDLARKRTWPGSRRGVSGAMAVEDVYLSELAAIGDYGRRLGKTEGAAHGPPRGEITPIAHGVEGTRLL